MADRGIGQQALQVLLEHREIGTEHSEAMPASPNMANHSGVPESTGHSRASRNTPALTMVAECRNADTGVGAAIALGSQKWKGNCALLVNVPSRISSSAGT